MKKYFVHCLFCFCLAAIAPFIGAAQGKVTGISVQGKITDKDNKPIHGVTVAEIDGDGRTIKADRTDVNGSFSLRILDKSHRLSISHISFKSIVIPIGDNTVFNQSLEPDSKDIGEVVVLSQRRVDNGMVQITERNLTTAQVHINAKELEEMQSASIDQALQGRLTGVDITASSGDPGAGMQIRIRGTSSINGSTNPLIVVDGLPYETSIPSDFNFGTADEVGYAQLLNIAPSDIRDISIFKDAASTAVWGSRAANGVIIINTKRGIVGTPVLTYTFKGSIIKQPDPIPMLSGDQYSTLFLKNT